MPNYLSDEVQSIKEITTNLNERAELTVDLAFRLFVEKKLNMLNYPFEHFAFIPSVHCRRNRIVWF
jgi:hypothetical protein